MTNEPLGFQVPAGRRFEFVSAVGAVLVQPEAVELNRVILLGSAP